MAADRFDLTDVDGERGFALVQRDEGGIRLAVSLERDGDYDVILRPVEARRLADALTAAADEEGR